MKNNQKYEEIIALKECYLNNIKDGEMICTHTKTGHQYKVLGLSENCTNDREGQILVRYNRLNNPHEVDFEREISEFDERFTHILI